MYDRRNTARNRLIETDKTCKHCLFTWPKGSVKRQAFDGYQSECKRKKKLCRSRRAAQCAESVELHSIGA